MLRIVIWEFREDSFIILELIFLAHSVRVILATAAEIPLREQPVQRFNFS